MRTLRTLLVVLLLSTIAQAQSFRVSSMLGDSMVLQREAPIRVWGKADAGDPITVTLAGQQATAAVKDGAWSVELPAMPAGGPYELTVTRGSETQTLKDVLLGDIWVCSGQSNMEWRVGGSANPEAALQMADELPQVRFYGVPRQASDAPNAELETPGKWKVCSRATAGGFSAVGFFFGRHLNQALNVPIGLIDSSWGGTASQAWTDPQTLAELPELKNASEAVQRAVAEYAKSLAASVDDLVEWRKQYDADRVALRTPRLPARPMVNDPRNSPLTGFLYNGMIHPLTKLPIKGVIWYQGESNAGQSRLYRKIFPAMIEGWRRAWGVPGVPFLFVQLPNFKAREANPGNSEWAATREAQTEALKLPHTEMAITLDIGEANDIHPRNKLDVGNRLGLAALKVVYGKDVVYSGPRFKSMAVEGDAIRIRFDHVAGGLKITDASPGSFAIAGEDQKFVWADARVDGDSVVVRSDKVAAPVAARYGWANNPVAALYNSEGLPAAPFRTDDWNMGH